MIIQYLKRRYYRSLAIAHINMAKKHISEDAIWTLHAKVGLYYLSKALE